MTPLSHSFDWRGRSVAWDRLGDGPPLVLLHGTPWSSEPWRPIARALSRTHTVYLWDMPGYGQSSMHPDHAVDIGVQAELFAALLQHWGLKQPRVIAHDIGGAVALRARLCHGVRYAGLGLVDVVALAPWGSPFFRLVRDHAQVFEQIPPAIHRGLVETYIRGASARGLRDEDLAMLVEPWTSEVGQAAFVRQIAQASERFTDDLEPRYGEIDDPVHIVWGTADAWIPVDRAHRLQHAIPHASLTLIEGAGHLVHLDAPAELAGELVRWATAVR